MTMDTMHVQTPFYAEVCDNGGPTGELVFVRAAEAVDWGGNVLGGPYHTADEAAEAIGRWRTPTLLMACRGAAYRAAGLVPCGGICCGMVENSDVRTLPVNVTDGAKAALDAMKFA